ncbi:sulfatase [Snuella sedimenti]|uniref:Sulfatase n=1 Tax=Snuella sedimenti TaxID=2798802 RepID=A0A8J7J2F5_9FLAO|nr:sulfatase [Snuella sedimenti]MBJ6368512.1 sulfatase [Snuella sedimenti]
MFRPGLALLVLLCVACANINCSNKIPEQIKPNVLLLLMDDLRPELGTYGRDKIHSPNMDKLASMGIQFDNAYCNVPVCGASRASMLTGMLPTKNRFLDYNTFVEKETPQAITLPQLFRQHGYTTISNGKIYHHLDDRETDWDEVWRPYAFDANNQGLSPTDYWQSLWKDYQEPVNKDIYMKTNTGPAYENAKVTDSVYIDGRLAQKVIRDIRRLKGSEKPFLLTAGFISNHLPFNAPKTYWDYYNRDSIKQPYNNYVPKNAPKMSISNWPEMRAYSNIPKTGQVSDSLAIDLIHGYYATVSYVDALIGNILEELKVQELDTNTIVVLVADHGYNLQEHTQWAKFTNYTTSTRVPLIIYDPRFKIKGGVTHALTELVDIYPTLSELCGLEPPKEQLSGQSLVPVLNHPEQRGKDHILIKKGNGFTIKTKDYCYTEYINSKDDSVIDSMLYDHRNDMDENENVVRYPEYKSVVTRLHSILHTNYKSNITGD